jgi:hypothetical protein
MRFHHAVVPSQLHADYGTPIALKVQISRERPCSGVNLASRYAVDYIGACSANTANCRFFRALPPQLCYSCFALNTSVVLCGLW